MLNAIIRKFGSPWSIHIELAREMGKSFDDRKKIQKWYENRNERERLKEDFYFEFLTVNLPALTFLKYRLWKEQGCCDPYVQLLVHQAFSNPNT
ncbi:hypothetical protein MASR2M17_08730 [Aminivibrio sp.]